MYHDQGSRHQVDRASTTAVNLTLRATIHPHITRPTARADIGWQKASPGRRIIAAINMAAQLAPSR